MTHHFIYNSQFGFLNGATLNLLILKIVLLYFDSSKVYLLQKFLETFIEWDWKFPVKLEELTQKSQSWNEETEINFRKNQYLSKYINYSNEEKIRLEKHTNPIMVVLTLGYPEQNCSYNVNNSTRKIILKEFENGIDMLNNAKNTNDGNENLKQAWKMWLNGPKFLEKYKHFLFILCIDKFHTKESENYCRFIESRIRLELIFTIEEDQKQIDYTHATSKENCLPKIFLEKYSGHYIQHWWVGIETNKFIKQLEFNKNDGNVLNKFVENIKNKTPAVLLNKDRKIEVIYLEGNSDELNECLKN
uniref:polynucleotide adenylyltransferase n=1 Tax=Meloidogyne enterolobii TaxID=390850 RepID=A0A6V7X355_MELEN|nr:unnamed protein product [Meloidogyne enterolobii]